MTDRTPRLALATHLQSTKAPWISLLVLKPGQQAQSLVAVPKQFVSKMIKGSKCRTSTGLFSEFARALEFPDYFGHNWDALEECLADLEWLPAKGYVLLVNDAEQVLPDDEEDFATFLEVLCDAGEAWGSGQAGMGSRRATPFHVLLTVSEREKAKRAHWGIEAIAVEQSREPERRRRSSRQRPSRR